MREPPPSYDDHFIVPQQRMLALIDEFEERLDAVQKVFNQHFPGQFRVSEDFQRDFWALQHSAEEISEDHLNFVKELINTYNNFQKNPDAENLEQVFSKLKKLRKFLRG